MSAHDLSGVALRDSLQAASACLECVELPPLTCLDQPSFERETDDAYMRLQIVERLGAALAIIASAHEGEAGFDLTVDALTRLTALAERMDVRLAVRNVCGSALEQPEALHELFRRVGSNDLGLCLDALEFAQSVVNPAEAVTAFADRVAAACLPAHAVPNLRLTESALRATLTALRAENFSGPIIVEARDATVFQTRFGKLLA
jgi:sugar phosphate isomerase/epimerase